MPKGKNTLIFMTSNVKKTKRIGFQEINNDLSEYFSKEFLARFDDVINYKDITKEVVLEYLKKNNIKEEGLISQINYTNYGLRDAKKIIQKYKRQEELI